MRTFCGWLMVVFWVGAAVAAGSERYYINQGDLYLNYTKTLVEAGKFRESWPADRFPEGNWGEATNGFQLSLRFEKTNFTRGEPIEAIILLRNLTDHKLPYIHVYVSMPTHLLNLEWHIISSNGLLAPDKALMQSVSARDSIIRTNAQIKIVHPLDRQYSTLTNSGTYRVNLTFDTRMEPGTKVHSGETTIWVEEPAR